jgi:rod shape-determining protein MreC
MLIFSRYTWWVGAMVGLALFLAVAGQIGVLNPFQGAFLKVTSPVSNAFTGVFRPVAALLSDAGNLRELQVENRELRLENEQLRVQLVDLQRDAERVNELEEALGILEETGDQTRVAASIVSRVSTSFDAVVSINRGSNHGIRNGMVVLSSKGTLIGTVTKTFGDSSFVRLISDSRSKVNAEVQQSKVAGIVRGNPGRTLTFDLAQADVKVGDTIVTSGLGGNYPAGLPIGRVSEVSGTTQDLYRKVTIEPAVRLSTATTVLVLTSFIPQRIDVGGQ